MKNFSKEKRQHLALVGLLTVAAVAGMYYVVIKAQRSTLENLATQISEHKLKASNAERLIASVPAAKQSLATTRQELKAIEEGMAPVDMYAWVIQTVGRFAAERKVEIPQFSREVVGEVGMFPKFPYRAATFNVRGTAFFHDLGVFLADFENRFPYARIQNIELDPAGGSAASLGSAAAAGPAMDPEKLAFRLEIVTLINPHAH